jgi:putative restriction endonuclease
VIHFRFYPDEVSFWRPSGKESSAIEAGSPSVFKLRSPLNYIAGGGFFVRSEKLPLSTAWDVFGQKNGAENWNNVK